jgi:hypothetical protein
MCYASLARRHDQVSREGIVFIFRGSVTGCVPEVDVSGSVRVPLPEVPDVPGSVKKKSNMNYYKMLSVSFS